MKFERLDNIATTGLHSTITLLSRVAVVVISAMVLLIVAHVIGRSVFRFPLPGTVELIEAMLVVIAFFMVAYTEVQRGHIRVTLVISLLPKRAQTILGSITYFICAVYFFIMSWYSWNLMFDQLTPSLARTEILKIPFAPFPLIIAIGSLLLSLECLLHVFHPQSTEPEQTRR